MEPELDSLRAEVQRLRLENHNLRVALEGIIADADNWNDPVGRHELGEQILIRWNLMAREGLRAANEADPIEADAGRVSR